ncbi:hypothetical protein [Kitasatospora sp. NPDC004289]
MVPANAEGSWSSNIDSWTYNFESRRRTDNHVDSNATNVSFSGCYHNYSTDWFDRGGSAEIELDRDISFSPDQSYGGRDNYCNTVNWGERTQTVKPTPSSHSPGCACGRTPAARTPAASPGAPARGALRERAS